MDAFTVRVTEVARPLGAEGVADEPDDRDARHTAHVVREDPLGRGGLPEEPFVRLTAVAGYEPDPGFRRRFAELGVHASGRRRVPLDLPTSCEAFPPYPREPLDSTVVSARARPRPHMGRRAAAVGRDTA
ncbi:hypothetical protein ACIRQY_11660 [Streptomyces sp. NPDC101490]|uniref:hypothetical protein n=1 Tax=Streptomyces sp. NPDC101490 TaxID=3366143 RepID=UPI003830D154